jgi:hypothetical protein
MAEPREGDRVRVTLPLDAEPGMARWYEHAVIVQSNPKRQHAIVRWEQDNTTKLLHWRYLEPAAPA